MYSIVYLGNKASARQTTPNLSGSISNTCKLYAKNMYENLHNELYYYYSLNCFDNKVYSDMRVYD